MQVAVRASVLKFMLLVFAALLASMPLIWNSVDLALHHGGRSAEQLILNVVDEALVVAIAIALACVLEAVELNWDCVRTNARTPDLTNLVAVFCGLCLFTCLIFLTIYVDHQDEFVAMDRENVGFVWWFVVVSMTTSAFSIMTQISITYNKTFERSKIGGDLDCV